MIFLKVVAANGLNFRKAGSSKDEVIRILDYDTVISAEDRFESFIGDGSKWIEAEHNAGKGFVNAEFVVFEGRYDAPMPPEDNPNPPVYSGDTIPIEDHLAIVDGWKAKYEKLECEIDNGDDKLKVYRGKLLQIKIIADVE